MKKAPILTTLLALGLALPQSGQAQVTIKGGVSHGHISNQGVLPGDLNDRTGFAVGLGFATPRTQALGFGIEGLYAQRGANSENNTTAYDLDYIDVPAYLRLMVPAGGLQPFIYAGPQLSFEVRCGSGGAVCENENRAHTTYGSIVGAGVRIGHETGLVIEARYIYGLRDLELDNVTDEATYRHRAILFLVGISF
jgi:hypothetical protein